MKKKFKLRYIFIALGIIVSIVIGIVMRKTFVGKFILIALSIAPIVIGIIMLKIKGKIKLRYIFIALGVIIAGFVIYNLTRWSFEGQIKNLQKTFNADMEQTVNSIVDERLEEFYSNQNISLPNNSNSVPDTNGNYTSIPDASDSFTDVSWPEDSASESTPSAESKKIVATISNSEATNLPYTEPCNLNVFESYDEAFSNALALDSGRYVRLILKANVEVEKITSTVSVFNPDAEGLEEFDDFEFKSQMSSSNDYRLTFKIPDNPYGWGYTSDRANFVAVFKIVTNEGTFYVSCAY